MRGLLALLLLGCGHRGHQPLEDDDEDPRVSAARCCMETKSWEAGNAGWKSPTDDHWILGEGEKGKVKFRAYTNLTYRFEACGSEEIGEVDLLLYDAEGELLQRDEQPGREPMMTWTAKKGGVYYLLAYVRETRGDSEGAIWFSRRNYDPD